MPACSSRYDGPLARVRCRAEQAGQVVVVTGGHYNDLPAAARRRLLIRSVVRPVLTTTALLLLYYLLPMGERDRDPSAIAFLIGLVLVAVLLTVQVRQIATSDHPRLRAIESLSLTVPLFILLFATVYYQIARVTPAAFSEQLTRTDSLYFAVTTFASVGFGDITAVSQTTRVLVMIQMVGDLILVGIVAHAIVGAVNAGLARKQPAVRDQDEGEVVEPRGVIPHEMEARGRRGEDVGGEDPPAAAGPA